MENYNIYDEIGRGTHSFVYKARRKRSIEYVAVKSTAKSRMDKILNEVPFLHKLESRYVLQFFDWYESSNHIWLILEYCMGGDLLNLITQDKQLPESAVKSFGSELVAGLQYLHSNGILYCDLKPANILIDEFGSLKYADFGLARRIPTLDMAATRPLAPGSPHYMAPELFQQPAVHSFASDFWALGCVLYELRTGRQPFTHTNFSELVRMIQTEAVVLPVHGCEMSPPFCNLLNRLLTKDPYQRISWDELVDHPFWDEVPRLVRVPMPSQEVFDRASPAALSRQSSSSAASFEPRSATDDSPDVHDDNDDGNAVPDAAATVQQVQADESNSTNTSDEEGEGEDDEEYVLVSGSEEKDEAPISQETMPLPNRDAIRPASAPHVQARGSSSNNDDLREVPNLAEDEHDIGSNQLDADARQRWRVSNAPHSAPPAVRQAPRRRLRLNGLFDRDGVPGSGLRKVSKLIFTVADCRVRSIIGNKSVKIGDLPHVQMEILQFEAVTPENLLSCTTETLESQLKEIYISLKSSHADISEKLSVMAYLHSLCCHARLAHVIVNSSLLKLLIRLLTQEARSPGSNSPMIPMTCLVLGVLFRFATFIAPSSPDQLRLLVKTLLKVIHGRRIDFKDRPANSDSGLKPRPLALACLGELLFYISTQQVWELPMEGIDCVLTSMEDPDLLSRYFAVRTLGNMLIHCTDALLSMLMNEEIVLALIRGLLQYAAPDFEQKVNMDESGVCLALHTTTTEALAQVLRHLRTPSSVANLSSRLKRSVVLFFAKPDVLNAVWRGVQLRRGIAELIIASLNIVNAFLDTKLVVDRTAESTAIKASRTLLLERIITFSTIEGLIESEDMAGVSDLERSEILTALRAKTLILLYMGIQLNRNFLLTFVMHRALSLVEKVLAPVTDRICSDRIDEDSLSPQAQVSALEVYLAQCAINVCRLAIRMALKLGADCFSSYENGDDESSNNNNLEHEVPRISSIPFELFNGLLQNPTCRLQLLDYFKVNANKHFTFFLRLMSKLLATFSEEVVNVSGDREADLTTGVYVSKILVDLFEFAATEANDIILAERQVLLSHLLPAVADRIFPRGGAGNDSKTVAVNCLRVLHVVLLEFERGENRDDDFSFGLFIRSHLLPQMNSVLSAANAVPKDILDLTSELLYNLRSSNSLVSEAADERLQQ